MRAFAASLLSLAITAAARAEPISVTTTPIPSFERLSSTVRFGPFEWRGGLTLASPDADFGGFSGLLLGTDCESLLAVSDAGHWLEATLSYEEGRLAGLAKARLSPLRDSSGQPLQTKLTGDAETLTRLKDGKLLVGFEGFVRFGRYDGTGGRFRMVPHPKDIDDAPRNAAIEAAGQLADGRLVAISEGQFDSKGNVRAWAWKDWRTTLFTLERFGQYRITDLAVMADGSILTLERRFTADTAPGIAIRRFPVAAIAPGAVVKPELLLEATTPGYVIDNLEGIAACSRDGETRVTVISDDNFDHTLQSTILLQFAYRP